VKFANVAGRLSIILDEGVVDVESVSSGRFAHDPQVAFDRWDELIDWTSRGVFSAAKPLDVSDLWAPSPRPRQVFALGLNYGDHAREVGAESPDPAPVFTKFPCCIAAPFADLVLPSDFVDWEVELVLVIGRSARLVEPSAAWSHVAGVSVGQDISERHVQVEGAAPQFCLGKSFPGFGPIGPYLVTVDEVDDPDDMPLSTMVNGEYMQRGRTSQMLFGVGETIARLSRICTLWPGDVIFTGTPGGIGNARTPKVFLRPGDELASSIEGIGTIRQRCVGAAELGTP
jgi:2,4-diketo-3-deoxy-L-fuconate hydrolase